MLGFSFHLKKQFFNISIAFLKELKKFMLRAKQLQHFGTGFRILCPPYPMGYDCTHLSLPLSITIIRIEVHLTTLRRCLGKVGLSNPTLAATLGKTVSQTISQDFCKNQNQLWGKRWQQSGRTSGQCHKSHIKFCNRSSTSIAKMC